MQNIGILIPAFNPDEHFLGVMQEIMADADLSETVVVVDDGSDEDHQYIFETLIERYADRMTLLKHEENSGKGAALKTGLAYFQNELPDIQGVATLDADGQHAIPDVRRSIDAFTGENLVLGVRQFDPDVPLRSRFGNILTSWLFSKFTGQGVSDTQTGLRVIPRKYFAALLSFPENHFEFEFKMLLDSHQYGVEMTEVPIETIYLNNNVGSNFRVVQDSLSIYGQFLKFAGSGIASFLIDVGIFTVMMMVFGTQTREHVMLAVIVARIISSLVNYSLNRQFVFDKAGKHTLIKYFALVGVQMFLAGELTYFITEHFVATETTFTAMIAKILADILLFIVSYQIQKHWIFKRRDK